MTRILIADEYKVVRAGVRCVVERDPKWSIVAEAADGREAIAKAIATKPDLAILGYPMPIVDGIEATRQIRVLVPNIEILIFATHNNEALLHEFVKAGARSFVRKSDPQQSLTSAIKSLAVHKSYFADGLSQAVRDCLAANAGRAKEPLSGREQSVVNLIAEGYSNKQIATALNVSVKTVESHRASIRHKLGYVSTADIVRYAIRNNLVQA